MKYRQQTIVVAIIENDKGEILLAKRNQPRLKREHNRWEFPGGGIELGESPEKALIREVKEETGLKIKIIQLLPKIYHHVWKQKSYIRQIIIISYLCQAVGGILTAKREKEIADLKFINPKDIYNCYKTLPQIKPSIKEFLPFIKKRSIKN